jgi:hypothetical protein
MGASARIATPQQLRTQPVHGPLDDRFPQLFKRLDVGQPASFFDRLPQVDEHDDAGLGRHAEAGDESDPDGNAEVRVPQPEENTPPTRSSGTAIIISTASAKSLSPEKPSSAA